MRDIGSRRAEALLTVLGLSVLAAGAAVYPLARDQSGVLLPWSGVPHVPGVARWTGSIPTLAHAFGFAALLGAAAWPWRRWLPAICTGWLAIELALELLQRNAGASALSTNTATRALADRLSAGTFDPVDALSIVAGVGLAYALMCFLNRSEARYV